jgi:hypothetical protein
MLYFAPAGADAPFEISVRSTAAMEPALLRRVERRVRTALRRFAAHIRAVRVQLADVNGPRGGVDKECTIAIRLDAPRRLLLIEDTDSQFGVAADRAADRAGHAVARVIDANREWSARRVRT